MGTSQPPILPSLTLSHPFFGLHMWLSWLRISLQCGRPGFDLWVGKIPWKRERLPTPVFWPREFHGLYSPWGHKELDTTEQISHTHTRTHTHTPFIFNDYMQLYSIIYMYHIFIHSSVDRYLDCFHVLAIVKSAAVNIGVHISFKNNFYLFS